MFRILLMKSPTASSFGAMETNNGRNTAERHKIITFNSDNGTNDHSMKKNQGESKKNLLGQPKKYVVCIFDIDGTLDNNEYKRSIVSAIRRCRQFGVNISIVSARMIPVLWGRPRYPGRARGCRDTRVYVQPLVSDIHCGSGRPAKNCTAIRLAKEIRECGPL